MAAVAGNAQNITDDEQKTPIPISEQSNATGIAVDDAQQNEEDDDVIPQLTRAHSLLVDTSDHSKRDELLTKCFGKSYDILTIVISIADITTDIMVLISYYNSERMTFFWISLSILLAAQIGYVLLFFFNFDIDASICIERAGDIMGRTFVVWVLSYILTFVFLLPFGHFVAFLLYFTEDESSTFSKWLDDKFDIERDNRIPFSNRMSERTRLAIQKLNKHSGFIMEAFLEALPQSILQLIAMVYFKETSWIAVGSITLSMTSIMTKSLIISQGLEWKSYIWCWLCVCTDFFSIFFIVSWLFLSNEHINGEFLGYFSVIGEVWCWKVMIGVAPFWALFLFIHVFCYFWLIPWAIFDDSDCGGFCQQFGLSFCFLIFLYPLLVFALSAIALISMLFMEISCFSILAMVLWFWCTKKRWNYSEEHVEKALKVIHRFISNARHKNNDRIIRILAVNYGYGKVQDGDRKLSEWIDEQNEQQRLHEVAYKEIRHNCTYYGAANVFTQIWDEYLKACNKQAKLAVRYAKQGCNGDPDELTDAIPAALFTTFLICSLPIYLLSRVVAVFYPYFIVGYLTYNELWSEMNLFEVVMLGTYIGLQVLILILGIFVFRTHLWLWHVLPGWTKEQHQWPKEDLIPLMQSVYTFYDEVQWAPVVKEIVMRRLGPDIGQIVWDYVEAMKEIQ